MTLSSQIEGLLFISSKPLSYKKLAELTGVKVKDIHEALVILEKKYLTQESGIVLVRTDDAVQFATHPDLSKMIKDFIKEDVSGELTRPALETLSVIAYRGPVAKHEIENIRGVNCSQSIRNLLIRGLIETSGERAGEKLYSLTSGFMRLLGITTVKDLPDFEKISRNEKIEALLLDNKNESSPSL